VLVLIGMWWSLSFSCLCCLRIWLCIAESVLLSTFLPFLLLWSGTSCPFMVLFAFTFCAEFLGKSFVVVFWWSYIVLVSVSYGRLLFLHLFWMIAFLGRVSWGWNYFHLVSRRPHSMLFLLEVFHGEICRDFDRFTFVCFFFSLLQPSMFFL
jgi:hypothetical protein